VWNRLLRPAFFIAVKYLHINIIIARCFLFTLLSINCKKFLESQTYHNIFTDIPAVFVPINQAYLI
ncbi:hypothetical protein DU52_03975, partial [Methanosarcina mazei]